MYKAAHICGRCSRFWSAGKWWDVDVDTQSVWVVGQFKAKLTQKTVPSCCYKVGAQDVNALTRYHAFIYNIDVPGKYIITLEGPGYGPKILV